jgi:sarcosine oxidase subunit alpha
MTTGAALRTGEAAGLEAAAACGFQGQALRLPSTDDEPSAVTAFFHVADARKPAFVDLQHDVTPDDIALATSEGYRSAEHVKRYTTLGMATDQGKTANVVGLAILAERTGRTIAETGTTVFRPPYTPVTIGAFAGRHVGKHYRPERLTPLHDWAAAHGASFVEVGVWLRAQWYARSGESGWRDSVDREAAAVRAAAGLCDVSTLGKIEVVGPDAARLLDLVYANTMSTLTPGRVRYGVMLREDGFVLDDGTCARFAPDRFFVTTTTANAARVLQHMEFCLQVLRPDLDAAVLSATDRWAQMSLAGPRSREVLAAITDRADLSTAAFPHMSALETTVCGGIPARLYRLSFSGELAYEIGVPAGSGPAVAQALMDAGAPHGLALYGTEALGVLRIEKGHVAGGELNGQTTARDLALGGMLAKSKDFIGKAAAQRPALIDPQRPTLVGLKPADPREVIRAGAHLLPEGTPTTLEHDQGFVTSACFSPALGHAIALGLLANGPARMGERVRAVDLVRDSIVEAVVCHPVFVDPEGGRTRV